MGGFAHVAIDTVKDLVADPAVRAEARQTFSKALRPMENYFNKTDIGKSLLNDLHEYTAQSSRNLQDLMTQENTKPAHLRTDPKDLHSQSSRLASNQVFGKNHARITAHVQAAEQLHGLSYSTTLQDHVAMFLKDTTDINALSESQKVAKYKYGAKLGGAKGQAAVTANQKVSLSKLNYINNKEVNPTGHNIDPVYTPASATEKRLHDYINVVAAPFIAIPHIGTVFNNVISGNLADMSKALTEVIPGTSNYTKWHNTLSTTGIFADTAFRAYSDLMMYKSGQIAKATTPDVGYWLNKAIHQPGFNALRDWQLTFTGATAKLSADRYAMDYFHSGSKRAADELQNTMGLNLREIKQQQGILRPDQHERAIYNYVDKKIFLNNALRRSYYSGANPVMRTALMYHGYVAAQGQLLRKEMMKAAHSGNLGQMAQFFTVAAGVFPMVGEGLKQLERLGRGQNPNLDEDIENVKDIKDHPFKALETYADAYAHMAGFGIGASYTQSASRNELANTIIGPAANMVARGVQDVVTPIKKNMDDTDKGKDFDIKHYKPLLRDAMEDTIPLNIGKWAAHKLVPTTKEEAEENPKSGLKKFKGFKQNKLKKLN